MGGTTSKSSTTTDLEQKKKNKSKPNTSSSSSAVSPSNSLSATTSSSNTQSSATTTTTTKETKQTNKLYNTSVTLFRNAPRIQDLAFDKLLETKGGLKNLFEFIEKLSSDQTGVMKNAFRPRLMQQLLQAMIDDDCQKVATILDFNPELLLVEPKDEGVTEIESKLTWQTFLTEIPFIMAQKLRRVEMTKTMLPYFEKLQDGKSELLKQWVIPEPLEEKKQEKQDTALQDQYIKDYFDALATTIAADTQAQVEWVKNTETNLYGARTSLGEKTKQALQTFRELLLLDKAIAIDSYFNIEQFLIASYRGWTKHFETFQTWDQRDLYAVSVIGFIQGLAPPPLAKDYCESLVDRVESNKSLGKEALDLKLQDGRSFYRASKGSRSGVGFTFLCGVFGAGLTGHGWRGLGWATCIRSSILLQNYVKQETQNLANLRSSKFTTKQNLKHGR